MADDDYYKARMTHSTVHLLHKKGVDKDGIIAALVREKQEMQKRLVAQESILPKKIIGKDGKVYVWRRPDELIPI